MPDQTIAVKCHSLIKSYSVGLSKIIALRGIELEVRRGELLMLAGPSGCGKTTLISVIAGILDQYEGECSVYGHDIRHMPQAEKLKYRSENIGFVFQSYNLLPSLTAAENVAVPLIINGVERKHAVESACAFLTQMGLGDRFMSMPSELSGGQQQRVAIARAFIHNPKLVVCDEPTSALDGETGQKVMKLLKETALSKDRALIVVTHDARIFEFADRIARMDDGRIYKIEKNSRHKQ